MKMFKDEIEVVDGQEFVPYYYVVRTYSGATANQTLWKVITRRMKGRRYAQDWMKYEVALDKKKKHEFFLIIKMERADDEYWDWFRMEKEIRERALHGKY